MKRKLLCIAALLAASFGITINAAGQASNSAKETSQSKIAFVYVNEYSVKYCGLENEPVYKALKAQYDVTPIDVKDLSTTAGAASVNELLAYDVVISSEAVGGTHKYGVALKNIINKVPMVNFKSYYYSSGRWNWGTGKNPDKGSNKLTVTEAGKTHALFDGVTIDEDNTCLVFTESNAAENQIQGYEADDVIAEDVVLATVGAYSAVHTHGTENLYVLLPFSSDAISGLDNNGIKLALNAVELVLATKTTATVETPVITYEAAANSSKTITIDCPLKSAAIHYTTDGAAPTSESALYTAPFDVDATVTTIKALAIKENMNDSEIASIELPAESTDTPVISSAQGEKSVTVTITCNSAEASIYYTLDGTEPTEESLLYTQPIEIFRDLTVMAVAKKENAMISSVASADIINTNYKERNKELFWCDFNTAPQSWEIADENVELVKKGTADASVERGGMLITSNKQRTMLMATSYTDEVSDANYTAASEEDKGATSKALCWLGDVASASIQSTTTIKAPFDLAIWACTAKANTYTEKIKVSVKTAEQEEWTDLETIAVTSFKKISKKIAHCDSEGDLMFKLSCVSENTSNNNVMIFDIKAFGEETGTDNIFSAETDKAVISREYYSITGVRLVQPAKGIVIEKATMSDGSIKASKAVIK